MLSFKLQPPNLFDQVSERGIPLYGTIPTNGVIFADTNLTSYGASLINMGNRLIKISAPASAGTTVNFNPGSASATASTSGQHSGSGTNPSILTGIGRWTSGLNTLQGNLGTLAGNHNHSITNVWSGATDLSRFNIGAYSMAGSRYIPPGGIVFCDSKPHPTYTTWGGYSNWLGMASTISDINTTTGSGASYVVSTTLSAAHNHFSGNTVNARSGSSGRRTIGSTTYSHSHNVSVTSTWTLNNKVYLWGWQTIYDYAPIVRGTTIGWNSTSTSLPTGWYFCDGGTYNGYTTLNLNQGLHVAVTPGGGPFSYGYNLTTGTDTLVLNNLVDSSSGTTTYNSLSHNHTNLITPATNLDFADSGTGQWYHGTWSTGWTHIHTFTPASFTYSGGPSSYSLPFIIYLP